MARPMLMTCCIGLALTPTDTPKKVMGVVTVVLMVAVVVLAVGGGDGDDDGGGNSEGDKRSPMA